MAAVARNEPETEALDFKRDLYADTKELVADVVSMANLEAASLCLEWKRTARHDARSEPSASWFRRPPLSG
jgi:hypothetical protein